MRLKKKKRRSFELGVGGPRRLSKTVQAYPVADPGEGPGGPSPPPLVLDQTEARRAQKNFLEAALPTLSQGLDDRPPPPLPI